MSSDVAAAFVQLDEVADDRDEVFLREHRRSSAGVLRPSRWLIL